MYHFFLNFQAKILTKTKNAAKTLKGGSIYFIILLNKPPLNYGAGGDAVFRILKIICTVVDKFQFIKIGNPFCCSARLKRGTKLSSAEKPLLIVAIDIKILRKIDFIYCNI